MMSGADAVSLLTGEIIPFWLRHGLDREHGGIMTCLDADGTLVDDDKGVWQQWRAAWLLARSLRTIGERSDWREALGLILGFARRHAVDADGRMHFHLDRLGRPIRKRRYAYSECFAAMACAEAAALDGDHALAAEAERYFRLAWHVMTTPGAMAPKTTSLRAGRSLGHAMIPLGVAQVFRTSIGGAFAEQVATTCADDIMRDFIKPEHEAVLEVVAPDGSLIDHMDTRQLNPGHAIEGAWFLLAEAEHCADASRRARLVESGIRMLDWSWRRGWDPRHGGLLNFVDLHGRPPASYEHDMKFWWPHCEAILAGRHAARASGDPRHLAIAGAAEEWALAHFADRTHGEWFGYLHRDGSVASTLKGNLWKGMFHLPRMLLVLGELDGAIRAPKRVDGLLRG
jgi:N-acylglucosamine 2-epimerase